MFEKITRDVSGGLLRDFYGLRESLLVELSWRDSDGLFHKLWTAPTAQEQTEELGVFGRNFEGFVHFARLVEIGEIGPRVVSIVPAALEENPTVVAREGRIAFGQRGVHTLTVDH